MAYIKFSKGGQLAPFTTLVELYNTLSEMDGVMDWAINQDGDVTVEYDHNRINEMQIEQVLSGLGLQLNLVTHDPNYPEFLLEHA